MRVRLIAKTEFIPQPELNTHEGITDADELSEYSGRTCYQSWSKPNPETATNAGYLKNILDSYHFSVLEHASVTFYIEGVSRSLTHELVRHRHLSYSQLSQRFVDESSVELVVPPALRGSDERASLLDAMEFAKEIYNSIVESLLSNGLPRKKAREAARAVLPNMTETKIVVTGNHRAWREFLTKRNSPGADAEIRELAQEILGQLKKIAPNTYQDMEL